MGKSTLQDRLDSTACEVGHRGHGSGFDRSETVFVDRELAVALEIVLDNMMYLEYVVSGWDEKERAGCFRYQRGSCCPLAIGVFCVHQYALGTFCLSLNI